MRREGGDVRADTGRHPGRLPRSRLGRTQQPGCGSGPQGLASRVARRRAAYHPRSARLVRSRFAARTGSSGRRLLHVRASGGWRRDDPGGDRPHGSPCQPRSRVRGCEDDGRHSGRSCRHRRRDRRPRNPARGFLPFTYRRSTPRRGRTGCGPWRASAMPESPQAPCHLALQAARRQSSSVAHRAVRPGGRCPGEPVRIPERRASSIRFDELWRMRQSYPWRSHHRPYDGVRARHGVSAPELARYGASWGRSGADRPPRPSVKRHRPRRSRARQAECRRG